MHQFLTSDTRSGLIHAVLASWWLVSRWNQYEAEVCAGHWIYDGPGPRNYIARIGETALAQEKTETLKKEVIIQLEGEEGDNWALTGVF